MFHMTRKTLNTRKSFCVNARGILTVEWLFCLPISRQGGGGVTTSSLDGERVLPSSLDGGSIPIQSQWGVFHPGLMGGGGVPLPVLMGVSPSSPNKGCGTPIQSQWGVPWGTPTRSILDRVLPCWSDGGYPLLRLDGDTPIGWMGVPPPSVRWGTTPRPHQSAGWGTPLQNVDRQTPVKIEPSLVLRTRAVKMSFEVFVFNTNLTFLYNTDICRFKKVTVKKKVAQVGIELTTPTITGLEF